MALSSNQQFVRRAGYDKFVIVSDKRMDIHKCKRRLRINVTLHHGLLVLCTFTIFYFFYMSSYFIFTYFILHLSVAF
jgi:hypothetical protein